MPTIKRPRKPASTYIAYIAGKRKVIDKATGKILGDAPGNKKRR